MILHLEKSALENQWNKNWARAVVATTYISRGKKSLSTVATVGEGAPSLAPLTQNKSVMARRYSLREILGMASLLQLLSLLSLFKAA